MTPAFEAPHLETGVLLVADISGYTAFLGLVTAEHPEMIGSDGNVPPAYPVLSSLLDVVVERLSPAFRLSEVEGDAVFGYASDEHQAGDGAEVLDVVRSAYGGFRDRIAKAMVLHHHDCEACRILPSLDLKFVAHHGPFVVQQIAGRERLLGPAVNVTHRLLKNSIREQTGKRSYLFVTHEAVEQLGLSPEIGVEHREEYADAGAVRGLVVELKAG